MTGSGTLADPYIIYDVDDLQAMKDDLTAYYELANDIDAAETQTWNAGAGFIPIGNATNNFTGYLDGCGYIISNLYINRPTTNYVGMIGFKDDPGLVTNVHLRDCYIIGQDDVGGLFGVSNTEDYNTCCSVQGYVEGRRIVGGFAGQGADFQYCYSKGTVHANGQEGQDTYCGGFVGHATRNIRNCYSRANVSADQGAYLGGFSGACSASADLIYCYSTGTVIGGGFNGYFDQTTDCFWDKESSGAETSQGGTGLTTAEAKTQGSYTNWDFTTIWVINAAIEDGYPSLRAIVSGWGPDRLVQAATAQYSSPVLSVDGAKIYCFWAGSPTANHIYYKKIVPTIDVNPTDWSDESFDGLTFDGDIACNAESGSYIGVQHEIDADVSGYFIRHHFLSPPAVAGRSQGHVIG